MLIARGTAVRLVLVDGSSHRPRGAILHDESGKDWPSTSVLIMPFQRSGQPLANPPQSAVDHFGDTFEIHRGEVDTPARDLREWRRVGEVRQAFYTRHGHVHPGRKQHVFGEKRMFVLAGASLPVLYVHQGVHRLELAAGSSWTWRGAEG